MNLLTHVENRRLLLPYTNEDKTRAELGQVFTPALVAKTMASMPQLPTFGTIRILDPGAGTGILTAAFVERVLQERPDLSIHVTTIETDPRMVSELEKTLAECRSYGAQADLVHADFIQWAQSTDKRFDVVIQNPPYFKLGAKSEVVTSLKKLGYTTPNIYAAFMALGARLLAPDGFQVSITPRSWMNGTYYTGFRKKYLAEVSISSIHTFGSRSAVFGDSGVLQETIIVCVRAAKAEKNIVLGVSQDQHGSAHTRLVPYGHVVTDDFVFIPADDLSGEAVKWMGHALHRLEDLGLCVSTGKVVGFRSRNLLLDSPIVGAVPLIQATNITQGKINHPMYKIKKPQWFDALPEEAHKQLVPAGEYVLIKRFSAKEEKRRIVAAPYTASEPVAFDNKLNYIHRSGLGLDHELALGLTRWFSAGKVDTYFRVFSGHTQVNATDLRQMPFPSEEQLRCMARSTGDIDDIVESVMMSQRKENAA